MRTAASRTSKLEQKSSRYLPAWSAIASTSRSGAGSVTDVPTVPTKTGRRRARCLGQPGGNVNYRAAAACWPRSRMVGFASLALLKWSMPLRLAAASSVQGARSRACGDGNPRSSWVSHLAQDWCKIQGSGSTPASCLHDMARAFCVSGALTHGDCRAATRARRRQQWHAARRKTT